MPVERRLVLVVAEYAYFLSHRLGLARAAAHAGWQVWIVTRVPAGMEPAQWPGITLVPYPVRRSMRHPLSDLGLLLFLFRCFRRIRPHVVHNVSLKLALIGSLAAAAARVPATLNAYTGLGYVYRSAANGSGLIRALVSPLFRLISRRRGCWSLFQNEADRDELLRRGMAVGARSVLISGGVDLDEFRPSPEPEGTPLVLFVGRLLRDKGIGEFVEASALLRAQGVAARFAAVGEPDAENPRSVDAAMLARWKTDSVVEWWGGRNGMPAVYAQSHVVCLPSYHEGLPKVLLEAAACARPVVATRVPGCADAVQDNETGFLVPPRQPHALAEALRKLLINKELRVMMGQRGRAAMEQRYAAPVFQQRTVEIYERLRQTALH